MFKSKFSYYLLFKAICDKFFAIFLLTLSAPILITCSILIFFFMGRPILFIQKRPGYKMKPFFIFKLRTMTNERDQKNKLLMDNKRISKFGNFLRKTSIDELPSLLNIIKGDMSFVGPRPLLMEYLKLYTFEQNKRHNVMPGLTGLSQISGRNKLEWEVKLALDSKYVEDMSFLLDLKILVITFFKVFLRKDVSAEVKFKGNI